MSPTPKKSIYVPGFQDLATKFGGLHSHVVEYIHV